MSPAHNLREQRHARAIDREVAPVWHDRFARLLWRSLPPLSDSLSLDVHCGTGRTTAELLERLDPSNKVVGLEPSEAMRSLAKFRVPAEAKNRVYFKPGDLSDVVDMADDTYDLVLANLVLGEVHDLPEAMRGLLRVCKPGGTVMITLPMAETWGEAEDLFAEVLRDSSQNAGKASAGSTAPIDGALDRLQRVSDLRPTGAELARLLADLGIGPHHYVIEQERFELLFRSGREFLFSPLIELGPLRLWKAIIGEAAAPQQLFFRFKETIDAYYRNHPFSVTIVAGVIRIRVPQPGIAAAHDAAEIAGEYWGRYPELDSLWRAFEMGEQEPAPDLSLAADADDELDIDIELDDDTGAPSAEPTPDLPTDTRPDPVPEEDHASRRQLGGRAMTRPHRRVDAVEEDAIRALLDQPGRAAAPDEELDALLDQVLEFAGPGEQIEELDDSELEELPSPDVKRPGETLKRIKALLPPPPRRPPPPPGRPPGKKK